MSFLVLREIRGKDNQPVYFPNGISIGNSSYGGTNNIGTPGAQGFGVGICPGPLPTGMSVLDGTLNPSSDNYGNYIYSDGSVMVWVPAFFYKYGTGSNGLSVNAVDIKPRSAYETVALANAAGYALHRAFYDGFEQPGFFIDKYVCTKSATNVFSSIHLGIPCDTDNSQTGYGINQCTANGQTPALNLGGLQAACKSRGNNFHSASIFMFKALALLSYAHALASTSATFCAWYSPTTTNFPKGCNNSALGDTNDPSLTFLTAGHATYPAKPKAGSTNLFAKTAHNGQNSGIVDVNGSMWNVAYGITSDATNYYVLKTSKRLRDLTGGNTLATDLFGATGITTNYDSLGTTIGALQGNGNKLFGSSSQVLHEAISGNNWNLTGSGVPIAVGGTNIFGNDTVYDYKPDEMCPIVSGSWGAGMDAGVWALYLATMRSNSVYNVGGRAALYL